MPFFIFLDDWCKMMRHRIGHFLQLFQFPILTFHNFFSQFFKKVPKFFSFFSTEKRVMQYIFLCFLHVLTAVDDVDKIIFYTASYQDVDGHIPFNDFTKCQFQQHFTSSFFCTKIPKAQKDSDALTVFLHLWDHHNKICK